MGRLYHLTTPMVCAMGLILQKTNTRRQLYTGIVINYCHLGESGGGRSERELATLHGLECVNDLTLHIPPLVDFECPLARTHTRTYTQHTHTSSL